MSANPIVYWNDRIDDKPPYDYYRDLPAYRRMFFSTGFNRIWSDARNFILEKP